MRRFRSNKALMWKEWRQNRWLFWVGLVVLSFIPIVMTLLQLCSSVLDPIHFGQLTNWVVLYMQNRDIPLFDLGVPAAVILGSVLLAQERGFSNPLEFLAATPVSRREILSAKYRTGLKMIWLVIGVNLAFIYAVALLLPTPWWYFEVGGDFVERGVALTAIYSLCFCLSTWFGNVFSSLFGSVAVLFIPLFLAEKVQQFANWFTYYQDPSLLQFLEYFSLPGYAVGGVQNDFASLVQVFLSIGLYALSVKLFERNPFEKNGRILVFGNVWKVARWTISLVFAFLIAGEQLARLNIALLVFMLVFAGLYAGFHVLERVQKNFGT